MSGAQHRIDVEDKLMTELAILHPGIVIFGENAREKPIDGQIWVRMSFTVAIVDYQCIGSLTETVTEGFFNVQIFSPIGAGVGEAATILDEARVILKTANLAGIEFLDFDIPTGALSNGWFGSLLRSRYRAQN